MNDLENAGGEVLAVLDDCSLLVQSVVRHAPNLVVVHTNAVGDALFKATQSLAEVS
ncbi:MAG: response regulator receiver protein, partial [Comamonadaceae bacterium]|nr:response regulator receiver protein [Comamonadaceae bacterium]